MLDPNPGLIIWTILTFVLLVIILRKFAWKPLMQSLQSREERVKNTLERADAAQKEAERLLEENRRQLAKAEEASLKILTEGRALGEKLKQEIVEKAGQQSRRMIEQAKEEIDRNKEHALSQLRGEVANLALQAAGKILDETLDEQKHRKIIDASLQQLPKS